MTSQDIQQLLDFLFKISIKRWDCVILIWKLLQILNYTFMFLIWWIGQNYFLVLSKRDVSNLSYIQCDVSLPFGSKEHLIWIISFINPGIQIRKHFLLFNQ
ncbi:unnamed protein product [Paramecium sonneborni]|uniref:Transmembrane protein n=1 Tax=Paramecium sonneborni TaxID=65129 RepID=A0A8S1Q888_9CILI|nr:unnamed protein product [Paramecium sonneborni]